LIYGSEFELNRRLQSASFRGLRLRHLEGGARVLTREMAAHFAFRGVPRERHLLWRDQNGDPVPGSEMLVVDIPMRRLGLPEEVTKAIFLCTELQ
jgi:hypothetical protein